MSSIVRFMRNHKILKDVLIKRFDMNEVAAMVRRHTTTSRIAFRHGSVYKLCKDHARRRYSDAKGGVVVLHL